MGNKGKSLINNTLIYAVGNIGTRLISFLIVPIYTFFLTKEELGYYDLILSGLSLVVPIVSFQLETAVLRWMLDSEEEGLQKKIVTNSFLIAGVNILVVSLLYFVLLQFVPLKYSFLIWLLASFQIFNRLVLQVVRGMGDNWLYMISGVSYSLLYLILNFILIVLLKYKVEGVLLSAIIATGVITAILFFKKKLISLFDKDVKDKALQKEFINFSLPLIPNSISWWAISGANRYIIFIFIGASANGLFSISAKFSAIIIMINGIFSLAWQESAITNYKNDVNYYSKIFKKYVYIFIPTVLLLLPTIKFLMRFVVQQEFMESWNYIPLLMISSIFSAFSSFLGVGYLVSKNTKGSFYSVAIGGIVTILVSLFLVPYIDLWGAATALVIGYLVVFFVRVVHVRKYFRITYPIKFLSISLVLYLLIWKVLNYENIFIEISLGIAVSVFTVVLNKTLINNILKNTIKARFFKKRA